MVRSGPPRHTYGCGTSFCRAPVTIAYHLLARTQDYAELGSTCFEQRGHAAVERRSVRRLEALGYRVTLEPLVPATSAA